MEVPNDIELVLAIVDLWYEHRNWAMQFLKENLSLDRPEDILSKPYRGYHSIAGTEWFYRTHGLGVDIHKPHNKGGIDFDFFCPDPNDWQLRDFLVKQYNDGQLVKRFYRPLIQDNDRWENAVAKVV
ncbi:DUF6896 domain-containing protein [Roseofilum sp. Guam]|uniref:DUF6896 domain-containing protein n=1 Tax=Roseofilum sp. Guam TaxID=2821502 RepID=UPI001B292E5F|nr:hypothetical protein [Roseofilum sp. Guam]MBP0027153.1 hypothetical protein [Roseofilum sp. Guam]